MDISAFEMGFVRPSSVATSGLHDLTAVDALNTTGKPVPIGPLIAAGNVGNCGNALPG